MLVGIIVAAAFAWTTAADARPPTGSRVKTQLVAAVRSSRARLTLLAVDTRTRKLTLDVSVSDPASYLKHRYTKVIETIYPKLVSRFASIHLKVFDARSRRAVLSYSDLLDVAPGGTRQQSWHIAWKLLDCARNLPLDDIEIDPDHAAPPCPVS